MRNGNPVKQWRQWLLFAAVEITKKFENAITKLTEKYQNAKEKLGLQPTFNSSIRGSNDKLYFCMQNRHRDSTEWLKCIQGSNRNEIQLPNLPCYFSIHEI